MAQIFMKEDVIKLLNNKQVFYIGDSNVRGMYKDIVQLIVRNNLLSLAALKTKQEESFNGDHLYAKSEKTNGRHYREERIFEINNDTFKFSARYYFITSCYSDYVEEIFRMIKLLNPDVVVYCSCVWDISRWGPKSIKNYVEKFPKFVERLRNVLTPNCYFVWLNAPMLSKAISGTGLILHDLGFLKIGLRYQAIEANQFTSKLMSEAGFNVLDLQYYCRLGVHRRELDGVHWDPLMVRYFTILLLTRISMAWEVPIPENSSPTKALQILGDKDLQRSPPPNIEPCFQFGGTNNDNGYFDFELNKMIPHERFGSGTFAPVNYNTQMYGNTNNFTSNERKFSSNNYQDFTNDYQNSNSIPNSYAQNSNFQSNNFQDMAPTDNNQRRKCLLPNPYAQNSDFKSNNLRAIASRGNNYQNRNFNPYSQNSDFQSNDLQAPTDNYQNPHFYDHTSDFPPDMPSMNNFSTNASTNINQNHNFLHPNTRIPDSNYSNFEEMNEYNSLARTSFFPNNSHRQCPSDNQFSMPRNVVRKPEGRYRRRERNYSKTKSSKR